MDYEDLENLINHIIFPIRLPNSETDGKFGEFFQLTCHALNLIFKEILTENNSILRLFKRWTALQSSKVLDSKKIFEQINSLEPGHVFAAYMRSQNSCLLIRALSCEQNNQAVVSSFQTQLDNKTIMSLNGNVKSLFPQFSFYAEDTNFIKSSSFAEVLQDLCNNSIDKCRPKTSKAGTKNEEVRDVVNPRFVYEWLSSLIAGFASNSNYPKPVRKKIRDDIVYKDTLLPFRRSGIWMSIKATLQIELSNLYGERDGLVFYKTVLAQIIEIICSKCLNHQNLSSDIKLQVIKKLSRRIKKLNLLKTDNLKCHKIVNKITEKSAATISELRKSLDEELKLSIESSAFSTELDMSQISMSDIQHDNPKVFNELTRLARIENEGKLAQPKPLKYITRMGSTFSQKIESLKSYNAKKFDSVIPLYDIENLTLEPSSFDKHKCSLTLYNLLEQYSTFALEFYQNDPMGYSRLILASIKIVCALDQIATNEFPLLLQHKIGFDSKPLESLLLPLQTQMRCAYEAKKFIDERNANSTHPSLVDFSSESSYFGAKYAGTNIEMNTLKKQILLEIEGKIKEKHNEVNIARNEYLDLITRSNRLSHTYATDRWEISYHASWCEKCNLSERANRMTIRRYEKYLPDSDTRQNLVVFELKIPESIRCLRDAIFILKSEILKVQHCRPQECKGLWTDYGKISAHANKRQKHITLGSTSKLFEQSHYKDLHPYNSSLDDFIVPNGYNFNLSITSLGNPITLVYDDSLTGYKKCCVFKVIKPYEELQFALDSTNHSENEIIALQKKCPSELSLNEFVTYGFHRAGARLQLKNLLATLLTRKNLTMSHQSVLYLITQSLHELEHLGEPIIFSNNNLYPSAHADFSDSFFCKELCEALDDLIKLSAKKWNDHIVLLTIIEIISRAISMVLNKDDVQRFVKLMRSARAVAIQWQKELRIVIKRLQENQRDVGSQYKTEIDNLAFKCLEIACFGIFTFYSEFDKVNLLMNSQKDVLDWLNLISVTTNYNILYGSSDNNLFQSSSFLINMLRRVKITTSIVESHYCRILNDYERKPLNEYVSSIWPIYHQGQILEWKQREVPLQEWYEAKFNLNEKPSSTQILQIGINGEFLVDSQPVGRLPNEILKHQLYEGYFSNFKNFIVYPSSTYGTYVTSNDESDIGEVNYEFNLYENDLSILEKNGKNNEEIQLIPREIFQDFFPPLLVCDYSHWLDKSNNKILLRDKFCLETFRRVHYIFDIRKKVLFSKKDNEEFFFIKSKTYCELVNKITSRLEMERYVHVVLRDKKIWITLTRMSLSFYLDENNQVASRDFRGFVVNKTQQLGTLIGLRKGLVLTEDKNIKNCLIKNKFIVTHGKIVVLDERKSKERHQQIDIDCEQNFSPAFFSFDIDARLKILSTGESVTSRFYLAALHAYTSGVLPDPFLEQTGTERALAILQSASCWSMKPYGPEAKSIMESIAALSPKRNYYPKHLKSMQVVNFINQIPSLAAHNGFKLLIEKLIADSERLETSKEFCIDDEKHFLLLRAYNRNLNYYNLSARLIPNYESQVIRKASNLKLLPVFKSAKCNQVNRQCILYNLELCQRVREIKETTNAKRNGINLIQYVIPYYSNLKGKSWQSKVDSFTISDWLNISHDLRNNWLEIYDFARLSPLKEEHKIKLTMLLSIISYNASSELIDNLVFFKVVSSHPEKFRQIEPPKYEEYTDLQSYTYKSETIKQILMNKFVSFETYKSRNYFSLISYGLSKREIYEAEQSEYKEKKAEKINAIEKFYSVYSESLNVQKHFNFESNFFDSAFHNDVNECFLKWRQNRELRQFLSKLQSIYDDISNEFNINMKMARNFSAIKYFYTSKVEKQVVFEMSPIGNGCNKSFSKFIALQDAFSQNFSKNTLSIMTKNKTRESKRKEKFPITKRDKVDLNAIEKKYLDDLNKSWQIFHSNQVKNISVINNDTRKNLDKLSINCSKAINDKFTNILEKFSPQRTEDKLLADADLWPRTNPTRLLGYLISRDRLRHWRIIIKDHEQAIEEILILWISQQRLQRCLHYLEDKNENALLKEMQNSLHQNWKPSKHRDWLILELEGDFAIRSLQVKVARHMIQPRRKNQNTIMQLNMGEGKTSVITPMIASKLSSGRHLVRVIVLKSLFNMNHAGLVEKMGNLLNKRVYYFPCSRDGNLFENDSDISIYEQLLKECQKNKGIVLTLPEYCLSFKLKGIELSGNQKRSQQAEKLINIQHWLDENTRDILDESDELLKVMYQLIYTTGDNSIVAGGEMRWKLAEQVLCVANKHFVDLKQKFGQNCIECNENMLPQAHKHFRFLNKEPYKKLCECVFKDILEGKSQIKMLSFKAEDFACLKRFACEDVITVEDRCNLKILFQNDTNLESLMLILRGFFAYEILYNVFSKRWRVNYGINPTGSLLQAVPFRAKDVPAERAQFAHADVAIMLTILSYYYKGLNNKQFDQVFAALENDKEKEHIYEEWMRKMPKEVFIDDSIREYAGVNLSDSNQKYNMLFPILKMYPPVINFWLNNFVFPKEAKQFSGKLSTSAWDFSTLKFKSNPTTGFSGTNETSLLLPTEMNYFDLEESKGTNGQLLSYLLLEENNSYSNLRGDITGIEILKSVTKKVNARVLLDVGALMIDLSNKQVAIEWLKLVGDEVDVAVFFDDDNNTLTVIDKKGKEASFETSPFKFQLDRCVIYLDDTHCRGTDLKIPKGVIGTLTLGKGVTKDRLMQACMRLRMLGNGHSVQFLASNEVHTIIQKFNENNKKIGSLQVIEWVIKNSVADINEGFLYWGMQGLSYLKREAAKMTYTKNKSLNGYFQNFKENESTELSALYNDDRKEDSIVSILERHASSIKKRIFDSNESLEKMREDILNRLATYSKHEKKLVHLLDEEQEVELEIEQQEERELERPPLSKPAKPTLNNDVVNFVKNGHLNVSNEWFISLPNILSNSSFRELVQNENAWMTKSLFATKDFKQTIQFNDFYKDDDFLRPCRWLAFSKKQNILVLLSGFETNELMSHFNASQVSLTRILPRAKPDQKLKINFQLVDPPEYLFQPVAIFSGNFYLNTLEEQHAYLNFIGYCPSPRTQMYQLLFEKGEIKKNGYVPKEYRSNFEILNQYCKFENDPNMLIKKIADVRNYGVVPDSAHHLTIFQSGKKPLDDDYVSICGLI